MEQGSHTPTGDVVVHETVNENTADVVTESDTQVTGGGDKAAFDFDQLEQLHNKPTEESETKEETPKEAKEESKEVENDSQKEFDAEQENDTVIKAGSDEETVELDPELEIPVNWNGETIDVPLQELMNNYSGNKEIQRRFTELDRDRKALQSEKESVDKFLVGLYENLNADNPKDLVNYLVTAAGGSPELYLTKLLDKMAPEVQEWLDMPELEREKRLFDLQKQDHEARQVRWEEQQKADKSAQEVAEQKKTLLQEHELSDEDYSALEREIQDQGHDLSELNPEDIVRYSNNKKIFEEIMSEIDEIDPDAEGKEELAIKLLYDLHENALMEMDDVIEVLQSELGRADREIEEELEEKLHKNRAVGSEEDHRPVNTNQEDPTWADLDNQYSNRTSRDVY